MDSPPKATANHSGEAWREEPILPKQKAVLEFLKIPAPPTRGGASNLIKAVFEGPAGNAHQNAWEAAKHKLHPKLYPPAPPDERMPAADAAIEGSRLKIVFQVIVLCGSAIFAWMYFTQDAASADAHGTPVFKAPVPARTVLQKPTTALPESKAVSEMIELQSTDGKTIRAKVLTLTKDTVMIQREDGQTFDLQLDRLTPESKQRIETYRAAKRTGQVQ
ncbi:hypothetical protein [Prosthecobacter sp.]|uniref:hypothetical protein n=1 Tax=Prosthecobacter sp. TaxID=1965333 RepID=UPI0037835B24